MRRLVLLIYVIGAFATPTAASAGNDPWIIYFPASVSDVCSGYRYDASPAESTVGDVVMMLPPFPRPVSARDSALVLQRTPYLLRPLESQGRVLPLTPWIRQGLNPDYTVFRASSSLGMFAVTVDSCWRESDVVEPIRKRSWPNAPDSLAKFVCTPTVVLVDTTGLRRATFPGARSPTWSPDGTLLAYRTVRANRVRLNGKTISYPESADSIVVLAPKAGSRDVFPVPSGEISWADNEYLRFENQGRSYGLNIRTRESYYNPRLRDAMVGASSPDGLYSMRISVDELRLYGIVEKRDLSAELLKKLGTGYVHFSVRSFWVAGDRGSHDLCLGVSWLKPGRYGALVTKYGGCEMVVVDAKTGEVKRREKGAFVGPTPDRTQAVIWQDGQFRFLRLLVPR